MSTPIYQHLKDTNSKQQFKFNFSSPQKITYPNNSVIDFCSGDNVNSLFGQEYHGAVVDEITRLKQNIVSVEGKEIAICPAFKALQTNMMITQGDIKMISNPTTRQNWFYIWHQKVLKNGDERASAFHLSSKDAIAAGFLSQADFDYAEQNESSYIFKRDWLGICPDEENSVFKDNKVYDCVNDDIVENLSKARYLGIDLGFTKNNKSDWTVVTGINKVGEVVFFKRFKAEGQELINKLKSYINNRPAFIDATAGGGWTIYSLLLKDCPNLEPFKFNNTNKSSTIETLAHYIHTNQVSYNNNATILNELLGYECEISPSGTTTYNNGKSSQHDDSVISLALAVLKYKESSDEGEDCTFKVHTYEDDDWEEEINWQNNSYDDNFSYNRFNNFSF